MQPIAWVIGGNSRQIYTLSTPDEVLQIQMATPAQNGGKHAMTGGAMPPGHPTHRLFELLDPVGKVISSIRSQSPSFIMTIGKGSKGLGWEIIGLEPATVYTLRVTTIDGTGKKIPAELPADFYIDLNNSPN